MKTSNVQTKRCLSLFVFILILSLCLPISALAITRNWVAGSGSWNDPANWDPYGIPLYQWDTVVINNRSINEISVSLESGTFAVNVSTLSLGTAGSGNVILNMARSINTDFGVIVGKQGTVNQLGGYIDGDIGGLDIKGNYTLIKGATNSVGLTTIHDGAVFNQHSGTIVGGYLGIGIEPGGVYNLIDDGIHLINAENLFLRGTINAYGVTYLYGQSIGLNIMDETVLNIHGIEGTIIYYTPTTKILDDYLGEKTYALTGGGILTPIPEPSTMLLLGFGLIGLIRYGRRKLF